MSINASWGTAEINPDEKISLYRFNNKERIPHNINDPLFATILLIEDNKDKTVIISLDLIWISDSFSESIKKLIKSNYNISEEFIFICATHTHSSPDILFLEKNDPVNAEVYKEMILSKINKVLLKCVSNTIPVDLFQSKLKLNETVYRRKNVLSPQYLKKLKFKFEILNRPVPNYTVDNTLTTIKLSSKNRNKNFYIVNYSSHPSIYRGNLISSEYPGLIRKFILNGTSSDNGLMFLQGFCGNLKPRLFEYAKFKPKKPLHSIYEIIFDFKRFKKTYDFKDVEKYATKISNAIKHSDFKNISENIFKIRGAINYTDLKQSGSDKIIRSQIHALKISDKIIFIGINGEIFMEYSLWIRSKIPSVIPVGYVGGMTGYIPDDNSIFAGGYEVERSFSNFDQKNKLQVGIEDKIKKKIMLSLEQVGIF
tara:strand:- start:2597 stop:3871 length:1275 start_codon:yes stop_codon:yes gene_type:complete